VPNLTINKEMRCNKKIGNNTNPTFLPGLLSNT
jgi:hypothetical protein